MRIAELRQAVDVHMSVASDLVGALTKDGKSPENVIGAARAERFLDFSEPDRPALRALCAELQGLETTIRQLQTESGEQLDLRTVLALLPGRARRAVQEVPVSEQIRARLQKAGATFRSNTNISQYLKPGDTDALVAEVTGKMQEVLTSLVIDTEHDHNTAETAHRVAKMFVREIFAGRYEAPPRVTDFPNINQYQSLYLTGPITIHSTCAHHFQPITGKVWVGIIAGDKVIGLSKFNRMVDWIASRPQIQEEMTQQIVDAIQEATGAKGIAVAIKAEHGCMTNRGVREHQSDMTTFEFRGVFSDDPQRRQEFMTALAGMKGYQDGGR